MPKMTDKTEYQNTQGMALRGMEQFVNMVLSGAASCWQGVACASQMGVQFGEYTADELVAVFRDVIDSANEALEAIRHKEDMVMDREVLPRNNTAGYNDDEPIPYKLTERHQVHEEADHVVTIKDEEDDGQDDLDEGYHDAELDNNP